METVQGSCMEGKELVMELNAGARNRRGVPLEAERNSKIDQKQSLPPQSEKKRKAAPTAGPRRQLKEANKEKVLREG